MFSGLILWVWKWEDVPIEPTKNKESNNTESLSSPLVESRKRINNQMLAFSDARLIKDANSPYLEYKYVRSDINLNRAYDILFEAIIKNLNKDE